MGLVIVEKRAFVLVDPEYVSVALGVLRDAGLKATAIWQHRVLSESRVPILVGDQFGTILPDTDQVLPIVEVLFTTEHYGRQKITRVANVTLSGKTIGDFMVEEFGPPKAA